MQTAIVLFLSQSRCKTFVLQYLRDWFSRYLFPATFFPLLYPRYFFSGNFFSGLLFPANFSPGKLKMEEKVLKHHMWAKMLEELDKNPRGVHQSGLASSKFQKAHFCLRKMLSRSESCTTFIKPFKSVCASNFNELFEPKKPFALFGRISWFVHQF